MKKLIFSLLTTLLFSLTANAIVNVKDQRIPMLRCSGDRVEAIVYKQQYAQQSYSVTIRAVGENQFIYQGTVGAQEFRNVTRYSNNAVMLEVFEHQSGFSPSVLSLQTNRGVLQDQVECQILFNIMNTKIQN